MITGTTTYNKRDFRDDGMVRLRDPNSRQYLHLSGTGLTRGKDYSWIGTRAQASALKKLAKASGNDWPFRKVQR